MSGMGRVVRQAGTGSGQVRVKNQEDKKKRGWEKTGADSTKAGKLEKQYELAQTENTGINTQRISGVLQETHEMGFDGRAAAHKPNITMRNAKHRLESCKARRPLESGEF